jgi:hypothetical protein
MTRRSKDNTVGPWAREKLDALGQYLNFYTTVLKKQGHWLRGTIFRRRVRWPWAVARSYESEGVRASRLVWS